MSFTFKKFLEFVDSDVDYTDDQLNEIFGWFRNNDKIEKARKERERLKGMSAEKKAALDKALKDFAAGKSNLKGKISNDDLEKALTPQDRNVLAKMDKERDRKAAEFLRQYGIDPATRGLK